MSAKIWTQADVDSVMPDGNGVRYFGDGCEFGDWCEFGNWCKFGYENMFGLKPTFGNSCCFCVPMSYIEYRERANRREDEEGGVKWNT